MTIIEKSELVRVIPTPWVGHVQPDLVLSEGGYANLPAYPMLLTWVNVRGEPTQAGLFGLACCYMGAVVAYAADSEGCRLAVEDYGAFRLYATLIAALQGVTIEFEECEVQS